MARVPVHRPTYGQIKRAAYPSMPGQPETTPWVFYDTQLYTSGTTTLLQFFQVTNVDRSISNMQLAGQLPVDQQFVLYYAGCDFLIDASASGAGADETGAVDDVAKLLLVGRSTWELTFQDKLYGPFPLSFFHASGGPTGGLAATLTAPESVQFANNGVFDGGFNWDGSIIIGNNASFSITLRWGVAQTLNFGNTNIRCWLQGALSRAVK